MKQDIEAALIERVKELTCLYGISQIATDSYEKELDDILVHILELLPPAWQFPEITVGKIKLDKKEFRTIIYGSGKYSQKAQITIRGVNRGFIEVKYTVEKPILDEGPFLKEERSLIETIAKEIAQIVERKENELEKSKLRIQLQHAERLATVGEFSAGVAHELNEPLNGILGFAQLIEKGEKLSNQGKQDIERIVNSCLHAREVIKKLMFFARQMPTEKRITNLSKIIEEGIYFLESRCKKQGIETIKEISNSIPNVFADSVQITQVLVNLVVNAIQAMPAGGRLTIKTICDDKYAKLIVEDTGIGMSKKVQEQLFQPFFTTKDIGQGTGLGLAVVYGIVESHNGIIKVTSKLNVGTCFEVSIPLSNN